MSDAMTMAVVLVLLVAVASVIIAVPVLIITRYQQKKRMVGMTEEQKTAYLVTRRGLRQFSPALPPNAVLASAPTPLVHRGNPFKVLGGFVSLAIVIGSLYYFFGGGLEDSVADDAIAQYRIAKRSGTAMDACVHAGIVTAAFLQAKNEESYKEWQVTERTDCRAAGLPDVP